MHILWGEKLWSWCRFAREGLENPDDPSAPIPWCTATDMVYLHQEARGLQSATAFSNTYVARLVPGDKKAGFCTYANWRHFSISRSRWRFS